MQCVTMESWTRIMYLLWDAMHWSSSIYFVFLVVFCALFLINLTLAVIKINFAITDTDEDNGNNNNNNNNGKNHHKKHKKKKDHHSNDSDNESDDEADGNKGGGGENNAQLIPPGPFDEKKGQRNGLLLSSRKIAPAPNDNNNNSSNNTDANNDTNNNNNDATTTTTTNNNDPNPIPPIKPFDFRRQQTLDRRFVHSLLSSRYPKADPAHLRAVSRRPCRSYFAFVLSSVFDGIFMVLILINTILLASEHYQQPLLMTDILSYANIVLSSAFLIEVVLRLFALGCRYYFKSGYYVFDFIIVILSWIEILFSAGGVTGNSLISNDNNHVIHSFSLWSFMIIIIFIRIYNDYYYYLLL